MLTRQQRQQQAEALARTTYATPINGLRHDQLTVGAFTTLEQHLHDNGNTLSQPHREALFALCGLLTEMAQGQRQGRFAFGLPTGMGKTSAIIAWCSQLVRLGHDHISVAVSASKIEALCDLKRSLIRFGVPAERIGLLYANGGQYSEPRTEDNDDRQIMLISHERVRSGAGLARFNRYRGKPRDVLLYDESLVASDAKGLPLRHLKAAVGAEGPLTEGREGAAELVAYLRSCVTAIDAALERAKDKTDPETMRLPLPVEGTDALRQRLARGPFRDLLDTLFDLVGENLRVISTSEGGAVWYEMSVPEEFRNILILDASYSIRDLVKADRSIKDAEVALDPVRRCGPLSKLKDYSDVVLHQMFRGGGRDTMEKLFAQRHDKWSNTLGQDIVDVVKAIPTTEAVLVFVFKHRRGGADFGRIILDTLDRAGIDTRAKVSALENGQTVEKNRINVATWGQETSLNCWAHCSNVILCGVLQRSPLELAGTYLGQRSDLNADVSTDLVGQLSRSEVCHVIYQALSRGTCRVMADGRAKPMKAWVIHRDIGIQPILSSVMPGARWEEWRSASPAGAECGHIIAKAGNAIAEYLRGLPEETGKVSMREVRKGAGLDALPPQTMKLARDVALDTVSWRLEGRSLARLF